MYVDAQNFKNKTKFLKQDNYTRAQIFVIPKPKLFLNLLYHSEIAMYVLYIEIIIISYLIHKILQTL